MVMALVTCWAYSNHDVQRHSSRWSLTNFSERAFTTLMMCLRGSACIYQGEELGLREADVPFEDLQDPYGIEFWPEFKGRDGCRTPMVWTDSNQNGGFSTAGRTWLPVPSEHLHSSVKASEADPAALIHHYRKAISFRHAHRALMRGTMEEISVKGNVLQFLRREGNEIVFCAFNLNDEPAYVKLPKGKWTQIGQELNCAQAGPDGSVNLGPWQPCLALKIG